MATTEYRSIYSGPIRRALEHVDRKLITIEEEASGAVPSSRLISTTPPLTGGGDLSANRTLGIDTFTSATKGAVPTPGAPTQRLLRDDGTWVQPPTNAVPSITIGAGFTDVSSATMVDWLVTGVTLPSWTKSVTIRVAVTGIFEAVGASAPYSMRVRLGTQVGFNTAGDAYGVNKRFVVNWIEAFSSPPATGLINIAVQAMRVGGGTLRFDPACRVVFDCVFYP